MTLRSTSRLYSNQVQRSWSHRHLENRRWRKLLLHNEECAYILYRKFEIELTLLLLQLLLPLPLLLFIRAGLGEGPRAPTRRGSPPSDEKYYDTHYTENWIDRKKRKCMQEFELWWECHVESSDRWCYIKGTRVSSAAWLEDDSQHIILGVQGTAVWMTAWSWSVCEQ